MSNKSTTKSNTGRTTRSDSVVMIDPEVLTSSFVENKASSSYRITCYGSSSAQTPEAYLNAARSLGYILAKRGHVCINGAGSYGCMAALNDGADFGDGAIVGVIHEMFLVDGSDWLDRRDGGAHPIFRQPKTAGGPKRTIKVAGGDDLQERKRLLYEDAQALVVLPGGLGTWDELMEMACARHLGLMQVPIVCVNVDNFYQPVKDMLERAYDDHLLKLKPDEIVYFVDTAEEAVRWVEDELAHKHEPRPVIARRNTELRRGSFYSDPLDDSNEKPMKRMFWQHKPGFVSGIVLGSISAALVLSFSSRRGQP